MVQLKHALTFALPCLAHAGKMVEKGKQGDCGSLREYFVANNFTQFFDLVNYPETNYLAKQVTRKGKTWGIVQCQRLRKKGTLPEDLAAFNLWKSKLNKKYQFGKFLCKNGSWKQKVGVPACPDRNVQGGWRDHFFKAEWKMWAKELDQCLEFSQSETMVAFDPVTNEPAAHQLAIFSNCTAEGETNFASEEHILKFTLQNKIVSNGKCLSPLAISENMHVNLDPCDTLANNEKFGTWLFFTDCVEENDDFQKFDYSMKTKRLTSRCGHGLQLAKMGNGTSGSIQAVLSSDDDGMNGTEVVSGLGLFSVGFKG